MRVLTDDEIDQVSGSNGSVWTFRDGPIGIVDRDGAISDLKDRMGLTGAGGGLGGFAKGVGGVLIGGVSAMWSINDHVRVRTPVITIREIPQGGGADLPMPLSGGS